MALLIAKLNGKTFLDQLEKVGTAFISLFAAMIIAAVATLIARYLLFLLLSVAINKVTTFTIFCLLSLLISIGIFSFFTFLSKFLYEFDHSYN